MQNFETARENMIFGQLRPSGITAPALVDALKAVPREQFVPRHLQRIAYVEDLLDRLPPGRPIVQITYGPVSPVPPGKGNYTVEHFDFILRNIPPSRLWIYRRPKPV